MSQDRVVADSLLELYSRKIFGFALSKTAHVENAKDLSQDILLALYRSLRNGKKVDNMDAWVHTICCYTWSNYLSKEKRHWQNVNLDLTAPSYDEYREGDTGKGEMLARLRSEVAYLSRLHREIIIRFYYAKESVERIAESLNIPTGTVKWHLFEVRKKLKVGMQMAETADNLDFKPVRLMVGHSGTPGPNNEPNCYFNSLLVSNICIAIYDKPLSVEEIARKVGAAGAYIEEELSNLEKSDLVRQTSKGKYQTNFIIETSQNLAEEVRYFKSKAEDIGESIYDSVAQSLNEIRALSFHGHDVNDTFLLWTLIPYAIWKQYYAVRDDAFYAQNAPEERKDGGKYIVQAFIHYSEEENRGLIPHFDIARKYATNGIKQRSSGSYRSLQIESWWSGLNWRIFDSAELAEMARVAELIESGEHHNEHDKLIISNMVEKGYVMVEHGKPVCLVPFFSAFQYEKLNDILEKAFTGIQASEKFLEIQEDMIRVWRKAAPSFIAEKEIIYKALMSGLTIIFSVMEYLERTGKLSLPSEQEKKRLTTMLWSVT